MSDVRRDAADAFVRRFGRDPVAVGVAPGRVNLIGDHTDYTGGFVLPIAVDRLAAVAVGPAAGTGSTIRAHDLAEETTVDLDAPLVPRPRGNWANYPLGVIAQLHPRLVADGRRLPALDLLVHSTVPVGAGLSSSAAVEVATAVALTRWRSLDLVPEDLVRLCRDAEHAFPGTPCGIMDMYIAHRAVAGHALCIDCREETHDLVPIPDTVEILVVDTGVSHDLGATAYPQRRRECIDAAAHLGIPSLRDATLAMVARPGSTALRRAHHVVTENGRVLAFVDAVRSGDVVRAGRLMVDSHRSLRDDFEVSCAELDAVVDIATGVDGVLGARMTGGGFGGCAVVLCRAGSGAAVARRIVASGVDRMGRAMGTMLVHPVDGAAARA